MTPLTSLAALVLLAAVTAGQRISTIQLDNTQYFISRLNPYAPELNFFLAYQYCRSLGLQLTSFETREKADTLSQYLKNAGYNKVDYWTSGNKLGTEMLLWMSTGLPFNATFDYMATSEKDVSSEDPALNAARQLDVSALGRSCVALTGPELRWEMHDCGAVKDFICEQTRCYYYNYGSIPVSAAQGGGTNKPASPAPSTAATSDAPSASYTQSLPTTPYPGLLENSVAPEEEEEGKPDPALEVPAEEVSSSAGAEDEQEVAMGTYYSGAATMSGGGDEEVIMSVTTSPHQPKRLEDLFPMERTRPIAWPRN